MVRGGHRFIVQPDEFAVEQLVELRVKGQGNSYRYKFVKPVPGSDGDLCRAFEVDESRCEPVDLGWGLFYELEEDYDDVADSWEFRMITDNLKQLLSGTWQVEGVPNGVERIWKSFGHCSRAYIRLRVSNLTSTSNGQQSPKDSF
jgi:hypothetical protein